MKAKKGSELNKAIVAYCAGKTAEKVAKKQAEAAKAVIAGTLNLQILGLEKGGTYAIQAENCLVNILRKEVSRVDLDAMRLAHPEIVAKFTKEKPEYHFNAVNL